MEGNTMVNLITLHTCPNHKIHILSPGSERSVRLIITFHFCSFRRTVTHQYFNMNLQIYCKNATNLYKVCPQIYLQLHTTKFKHVRGPTILLGLPVCCFHGNPCTLNNSFMWVIYWDCNCPSNCT